MKGIRTTGSIQDDDDDDIKNNGGSVHVLVGEQEEEQAAAEDNDGHIPPMLTTDTSSGAIDASSDNDNGRADANEPPIVWRSVRVEPTPSLYPSFQDIIMNTVTVITADHKMTKKEKDGAPLDIAPSSIVDTDATVTVTSQARPADREDINTIHTAASEEAGIVMPTSISSTATSTPQWYTEEEEYGVLALNDDDESNNVNHKTELYRQHQQHDDDNTHHSMKQDMMIHNYSNSSNSNNSEHGPVPLSRDTSVVPASEPGPPSDADAHMDNVTDKDNANVRLVPPTFHRDDSGDPDKETQGGSGRSRRLRLLARSNTSSAGSYYAPSMVSAGSGTAPTPLGNMPSWPAAQHQHDAHDGSSTSADSLWKKQHELNDLNSDEQAQALLLLTPQSDRLLTNGMMGAAAARTGASRKAANVTDDVHASAAPDNRKVMDAAPLLQRTPSLPRILLPIGDGDGDGDNEDHDHAASTSSSRLSVRRNRRGSIYSTAAGAGGDDNVTDAVAVAVEIINDKDDDNDYNDAAAGPSSSSGRRSMSTRSMSNNMSSSNHVNFVNVVNASVVDAPAKVMDHPKIWKVVCGIVITKSLAVGFAVGLMVLLVLIMLLGTFLGMHYAKHNTGDGASNQDPLALGFDSATAGLTREEAMVELVVKPLYSSSNIVPVIPTDTTDADADAPYDIGINDNDNVYYGTDANNSSMTMDMDMNASANQTDTDTFETTDIVEIVDSWMMEGSPQNISLAWLQGEDNAHLDPVLNSTALVQRYALSVFLHTSGAFEVLQAMELERQQQQERKRQRQLQGSQEEQEEQQDVLLGNVTTLPAARNSLLLSSASECMWAPQFIDCRNSRNETFLDLVREGQEKEGEANENNDASKNGADAGTGPGSTTSSSSKYQIMLHMDHRDPTTIGGGDNNYQFMEQIIYDPIYDTNNATQSLINVTQAKLQRFPHMDVTGLQFSKSILCDDADDDAQYATVRCIHYYPCWCSFLFEPLSLTQNVVSLLLLIAHCVLYKQPPWVLSG
jgi:hypothetical protein